MLDLIWEFVCINEKAPNLGFRLKFLRIPLTNIAICWYDPKQPKWINHEKK